MDLADRRGWSAEPQALGLHVALAMVNLERGRFAVSGDMSDDGLADGTGTDVACRLALAIVAVDQASARGDGIWPTRPQSGWNSIQVQAGRLPPMLARWCITARAAADLAAGRWTDAVDRICALEVGPSYPDALGRIVLAKARPAPRRTPAVD